jgi:hypothetical protein
MMNMTMFTAKKYNWPRILYVRCLPHCLNLVMKVLLDQFDAAFKFVSNLKALRAFIIAGGSPRRRHVLREFAVTLSRIDFADTRWLGLINSLLYFSAMQTDFELKAASVALTQSAAAGDADAANALLDPGAPQMHIDAIYEFVENIVENEG